MTKILIVGIGGIGGYFGGLLSRLSESSTQLSIYFMARGQNLLAIQSQGLHIKTPQEEFTAHSALASDNPLDFGQVDYIILCTKSYDLEQTIQTLAPTVGKDTVFIPLLNGVDSHARIRKVFPDNLVTEGCANIIARLTAPGTVESFSAFQTIRFGVQHTDDPRLDKLKHILDDAGIDARLTNKIWTDTWEKFIFISSAATATSYYNKTFGEIQDNAEYLDDLMRLIDEIQSLAQHKGIELSDNIREKTLKLFDSAPSDSTTSMHSDFLSNKGKTEVESLTGYVVKESEKYQLPCPTYQKMYSYLSASKIMHAYRGYH